MAALRRLTGADLLSQPTTKRARARTRRLITAAWMDASRREFEATGNPIHAWEAYRLARKTRVPVPELVLEYFGRVAARVSSLARDHVPRKNGVAKAVASAVGLDCRGRYNPFDPFNGWWRAGHELLIACHVYSCHADNWSNKEERKVVGDDWKTICEAGAQRHNTTCDCGRSISWKTAERYFRQHAKSVVPEHLHQRFRFLKNSLTF
jgi:hypothetical protein